MASKEVEFQQPKKAGLAGQWESTKEFLWNSEKKSVMGRQAGSWAKIGLFYMIYYSCLAGFFAICVAVFFMTLEDGVPSLTRYQSLIKQNPGMGFRPQIDVDDTLINFEQGVKDSYAPHVDNLQSFLKGYSNDSQSGLTDCTKNSKEDVPCMFPLEMLGPKCTYKNNFGYNEGQPCVLLKLNKVFYWEPEAYGNESKLEEDAPEYVKESYKDTGVLASCEGENYADRDNIGPVEFWPKEGFPFQYFPYENQEGYMAPLVMVQFIKPKPGTLIKVWCKAWASNIYHHQNDRAGSVRFELLVD